MRPKVEVTGVKEIDDALKAMPLALSDRTLQNASANAAKPLVTKAKLLAPEGPNGYLVDSIGVVKGRFGQVASQLREVGSVEVGPRRGKFKGYHAHLVEYGTKERVTKGRGKVRKVKGASRGVMPAKKFMEPAFNATKDLIRSIYKVEVGKAVIRTMRRFLK